MRQAATAAVAMAMFVFAFVTTTAVTGCGFKGGPANAAINGENVWRVAPTTMRVYPTSRFVQQDEQFMLEARVELLDEMNDPVKSSGRFRFELYPLARAGAAVSTQRLYAWDVALSSLADQRRYYDAITRTYSFRLKLDSLDVAGREMTLVVSFAPATGARLEATAMVTGRE